MDTIRKPIFPNPNVLNKIFFFCNDLGLSNIEGLEGKFELNLPIIEFSIGWTEQNIAKIAGYIIDKGRDFLGLNDKEVEEILQLVLDNL
jgi:hypothetical protein